MRYILFIISAVLFISCKNQKTVSGASTSKGKLVIIGGGSRDSSIMQELIQVSGWKSGDWISIASMASRWDSAYISMNNEFRFYTKSNIRCIRIDSNTIKIPATLDSLRNSKIVYLNGGDQSTFMMHIQGTAFKQVINDVYENGGTIAGTSAGAALMSEKMLTGNQKKQKKYTSAIPVLWKDNVEITEGLGFLDSVIIDQHFIIRSRHNRLLSAILDNPKLMGIAIDESTAILVKGDSATVLGESSVQVYKNKGKIITQGENLIASKEFKISIYLPGESFKIRR